MESRIIIGTSENVRFALADTTNLAKKAVEHSIYDETLSTSEIALLNIASVISSSIKGKNNKFYIVLKADGLLGKVKLKVKSNGEIISSTSIDKEQLEKLNDCKTIEEFKEIYKIGKGSLLFEADLGLKTPYLTEIVVDENDTIEEVFQKYYKNSEQLNTVIKTGLKLDENNKIVKSGAIFLQALPNSDLEKYEMLVKKINMIYGIQELLAHDFSLENIVKLIFEDIDNDNKNIEDYKILEERNLIFKCDCSYETFKELLSTVYKKEEIIDIIKKENFIETVCGFCNAVYRYEEWK